MGKAVAKEFVKRGADVTIIARTQSTLDAALVELKSAASEAQKIRARSVDCTDSDAIVQAFEKLGTPDVIFCCAGEHSSDISMRITESLLRNSSSWSIRRDVVGGSGKANDW